MIELNQLQQKLALWQAKNFPPENSTVELLALGVCEEAGELAHAVLKQKQGIRESGEDKIVDACADVIIYSLQILSKMGYPAEKTLHDVSKEVLARNWKDNPTGDGYSQHKEEKS